MKVALYETPPEVPEDEDAGVESAGWLAELAAGAGAAGTEESASAGAGGESKPGVSCGVLTLPAFASLPDSSSPPDSIGDTVPEAETGAVP